MNVKEQLEHMRKVDRVLGMSEIAHGKFSLAAKAGDQESMDTARNEVHAVVDELLDLKYDTCRMEKEAMEEMARKMDKKDG